MTEASGTVFKNFRKDNFKAFELLILPFVFGVVLFATLNASLPIYILGQLCGIVFFVQCFILLHEFGHGAFFKSQRMNAIFGSIFSIFVLIPFYNWKKIHHLHHKWTGWRDKDPTTEKTFADRFNAKQIKLIDFCWRYNIPLFTLGYRFGIYWKAEKLKRHLNAQEYRICINSMITYGAIYTALIFFYGSTLVLLLPAMYFAFVITDVISLSQHSSIAIPVSGGKEVKPLPFGKQSQYSRSLVFSPAFSKYVLFNFNFHEVHHAYPGLSCYHIGKVKIPVTNSFEGFSWARKVKGMSGFEFIFTSSPDRKGF